MSGPTTGRNGWLTKTGSGFRSVLTALRGQGSNRIGRESGLCGFIRTPSKAMTMGDNNLVDTSPMDGLYSRRILRAVVQALDIEDEVLDGRTARRFYAGEPVNEYNRNQIFDAFGQALITRGLAPETLDDLPEDLPMAAAVGMSVMMVCGQWDRLMAHVQGRSGRITDVREAGTQCLRLVIVDLALRLFALARLNLASLPGVEPPTWVLENGIGKILRQHLRQAGLTRDQLAARLGVSPTSVDNWLDGRNRPSAGNVTALAEELASTGVGRSAGELQRELNRQFSLASLAELLAAGIGRDRVIELTVKLAHFTRVLSASQDVPRLLGDNSRGVVRNLLILGCAGGSAPRSSVVAGKPGTGPGLASGHTGCRRSMGARISSAYP